MTNPSNQPRTIPSLFLVLLVTIIGASGLIAVSHYSFSAFHNVTEFLTAFVYFLIFAVTWHARNVLDNRYILFLGISSLASGLLVFAHIVTYQGMLVSTGPDIDTAMEFWTASRSVSAASFLLAPLMLKRQLRPNAVLAAYAAVALALFGLIVTDRFPECYTAQTGMTTFKIMSDYVIVLVLAASLVLLAQWRDAFDRSVFMMLTASIGATMFASSLSYTGSLVILDRINIAGHLFELLASYLLYRTIVVTGITQPARVLFRQLQQSEERARESEDRYRTLVDLSPDAISVLRDGSFAYLNRAAVILFGAGNEDQLLGREMLEQVHPDDRSAFREQVRRSYDEKEVARLHGVSLLKLDGAPVDVEIALSPSVYSGMPAIQLMIRDVTEKKRIERDMEHLASFPKLNPSPVIEIDAAGKVRYANEAAAAILSGLGLTDVAAILPPDLPELLENLNRIETPATLYREVTIRDRTYAENVYLSPDMGVVRIYATDITAGRKAEEAMRASEALLRAITDGTPDCVFVKDRESRLLLANPAMLAVIGRSAEEAIGKTDGEIYSDPAVGQAVMENDRRIIASGRSETFEERIQTPRGYRTFLTAKTPYRDPGGGVIGIIGIGRDITERVELMENLQKAVTGAERNRSRLEAIFTAQTDVVILFDRELQARKVNNAFILSYGFDPVGLNLKEILQRVSATAMDGKPATWNDLPTLSALQGKTVVGIRFMVIHADGTSGVVESSSSPMREGDTITGCVTVWHDVTDRVKAETELQKAKEELELRVLSRTTQLGATVATLRQEIAVRSRVEQELLDTKERLQGTLESIQDGFFALDREWTFTYVNSEATRLFNRERDQLIGSSYWDMTPEARGTEFEREYRKVMQEQRPSAFEALSPLLHRWLSVRAYPLDQGISVYVQDISERKQAEQHVRITNDLLKLFAQKFSLKEYLDAAVDLLHAWSGCRNVGIRVVDKNGHIPYISSTGFTADFLHDESMLDVKDEQCACTRVISGELEPPDRRALSGQGSFYSNNSVCFMDGLTETEKGRFRGACMASGFTSIAFVPIRYREQTLGVIHLADEHENMVPLENVELVERTGLIIGEAVYRFGIEEELRSNYRALQSSEARYRALIEDVRDVIFTVMPDGTISSFSPAFEVITGYRRDEWVGTHFSLLIHPDDAAEATTLFQRIIAGEAMPLFELRCRTRSGEYRHMEFKISSGRSIDGQILGTARDITERRFAEEERARLVSAVESAGEAVVVTSPLTGVIEYVNPAFEQMTGYTREEALGRTLHFLDGGMHGEEFYTDLREALGRDGVWNGKLTNRKKNGTLYFEECTVSGVRNRNGKIINYVYLKRDVTERMRLQSIAEAVNTMNNIGYVFSGISHELGNPVTSLMVNLDLLREKLDGALTEYVDRLTGEVTKIDYLLGSLRSFNLFEVQDIRDVAMVPFMDQFLSLVREDFARRGITIAWTPTPDAGIARADSRALQQVLLNIFTNAADALEDAPHPSIAVSVSRTGTGVITLRVTDNGIGMTEEQQANLFRPFHTSKRRGTGLGMVIVKNMLSRMNASIEVVSLKGEGTTVVITIPEGAHGEH
jgi:PAS domain S-box-containing protein